MILDLPIIYMKLESGDDIVAYHDNEINEKEIYTLYYPMRVLVNTTSPRYAGTLQIVKWAPISKCSKFDIPEYHILYWEYTDEDRIIEFYQNAIDHGEWDTDPEKTEPTEEDVREQINEELEAMDEMLKKMIRRQANSNITVH